MAITEDKWGTVGYLEEYSRWSVSYNREATWAYSHRKGDYLLRPIVKTEEFELEAEVFNFSVDEDESYVSDFILHNSKSGFAYSDSFTVTSRHGRKKRTYVAVLDESEKGTISLLHEEPCGSETGVVIQIAIRSEDIQEFHQKAKKLFQFFSPRPEINTELPPLPALQMELRNGVIYDDTRNQGCDYSDWIAVMGCVSYRINLDQLGEQIPKFIRDISGALYFKIGEVQISASREELKYSSGTKSALIAKFDALVEEYVQETIDEIEKSI
jgi:hypothetical protein